MGKKANLIHFDYNTLESLWLILPLLIKSGWWNRVEVWWHHNSFCQQILRVESNQQQIQNASNQWNDMCCVVYFMSFAQSVQPSCLHDSGSSAAVVGHFLSSLKPRVIWQLRPKQNISAFSPQLIKKGKPPPSRGTAQDFHDHPAGRNQHKSFYWKSPNSQKS